MIRAMNHPNNLQGPHHRYRRLAWRAGTLAINTSNANNRRLKKLWRSGFSTVLALLVLAGFWLYQLPGQTSSSQTRSSSSAPVNHEPQAPKVEDATETKTPVSETPTTSTPKTEPAKSAAPKPQPVAPAAFSTPITIVGNQECKDDTLEALKLLSSSAPIYYNQVTQYVGVIECVTQGSGMAAYESPPRYLVGDLTRQAGAIWYAGTIVHDSTHSKLYHEYANSHPDALVPGDVWTGKNAEAACLDVQMAALKQIGADQFLIDAVANSINTNYWDIPYDQRTW